MSIDTLITLFIGFIFLFWITYLIYKIVYFIIHKRQYTREYFAFFSLAFLCTISTLCISYLFANNIINAAFTIIINEIVKYTGMPFSNVEITLPKPSFANSIVALVIIYIIYKLIINIFKNWDGVISERIATERIRRERASIIDDTIAYLKMSPELKAYNPHKSQEQLLISIQDHDVLPWHIEAAELINIESKQFKINIENDWYSEGLTYISSYGQNSKSIAIYCPFIEPSKEELERFLSFANNIINNIERYLVVISESNKGKHNIDLQGETLEIRSKSELLVSIADFSNYKIYIKNKFENDEIIHGYDVCLNDVYTTSNAKIRDRSELLSKDETEEEKFSEIGNIEEYVYSWINDNKDNKQLAILGEFGQGKSVLAQRICYNILEGKVDSKRIPLLIELRGKFPKQYSDKISLFSDWASAFAIDPRALLKLHNAGKLVIIFEGFDEMELVGDYTIRIEHFKKLWEFSAPNSKIIITGRPNFFLNDSELKTLLRTSQEYKATNYHCEEVHIEPFNVSQIESFLRYSDVKIRTDILKTIEKQGVNSSFYDLIARPSHLFMTSLVWEERLSKYEENINSALVYKEFLNHCYSRQDEKEISTPLSVYERAYFMQGIAVNMAINSVYTNQISQRKLNEIIVKLLSSFPDEISQNQAVVSQHIVPLRTRFEERYNKDTVMLDIRACGILVRDLSTFDSFKFAHKSFMEYLASDYYLTQLLSKTKLRKKTLENIDIDIISANSIKRTLEISNTEIQKTNEIINFVTQLLCNKINLSGFNSEKEKALYLFKIIYPFKLKSLKIALLCHPYLSLSLENKIKNVFLLLCGYFTFYYIGKYMFNLLNIEVNIYTLSLITLLFSLISIFISYFIKSRLEETRTRVVGVYKVMYDELYKSMKLYEVKKPIIDNDNLILWFKACTEVGVSKDVLKDILGKRRYRMFERNIKEMSEHLIIPLSSYDIMNDLSMIKKE